MLSGSVELPLGKMVSADGLRFVMFPENFSTADLAEWQRYADASPEVTALSGMPIVWDEIAHLVVRSQVVSLIAAFVLVTIMLGVAYRRLRQTIASLVPIILTVSTLLGFLAVSNTQLNLMTAVLSSIVIGVGIDYAIHFIAAIDLARQGTRHHQPGHRAGRPADRRQRARHCCGVHRPLALTAQDSSSVVRDHASVDDHGSVGSTRRDPRLVARELSQSDRPPTNRLEHSAFFERPPPLNGIASLVKR